MKHISILFGCSSTGEVLTVICFQEWIPASKLAVADKLGMRHLGRPTVRPAPLYKETDVGFGVGSAVDAWWSDGWWEGVVTSKNEGCNDVMQVYFPGTFIYSTLLT